MSKAFEKSRNGNVNLAAFIVVQLSLALKGSY